MPIHDNFTPTEASYIFIICCLTSFTLDFVIDININNTSTLVCYQRQRGKYRHCQQYYKASTSLEGCHFLFSIVQTHTSYMCDISWITDIFVGVQQMKFSMTNQ